MDRLINYYNTLFGIEIAVFGIISAVILVFIQLVFSNYSYKHIGQILNNWLLKLFFVLCTIDLLLTTTGGYFLSIGKHDLIPFIDFNIQNIITNQFYVISCVVLIFISISFFIILIVKNITYLQPHRAIFLLAKGVTYKNIRDYIWKTSKIAPPINIKVVLVDSTTKKEENSDPLKFLDNNDEEIEKEIEDIKKKTRKSEDPLLPLIDMMVSFIKKTDINSLREANGFIIQISKDFIENASKDRFTWTHKDILISFYNPYIFNHLQTLIDLADKEKLETAKISLLEISYEISTMLFEKDYFDEINQILFFWKNSADSALGNSPVIFKEIIKYFDIIGNNTLSSLKDRPSKKQRDERDALVDHIFQNIGWLAERLVMKDVIEEIPIMYSQRLSTEYEVLFNSLINFGDKYSEKYFMTYPLIFFDAVSVFIKRLIEKQLRKYSKSISENIYSLALSFSSFAESALNGENATGAALAITEIEKTYRELKVANFDSDALSVVKTLIHIGIIAANKKSSLDIVEFIGKPLDDRIIDFLGESNEQIDNEVFNSFIHTFGLNHELSWDFIKRLGHQMMSNFSLMFDPLTGKDYEKDDPRRR